MGLVLRGAAGPRPKQIGERTLRFVISTDEADRYGDRVLQDGILDGKRHGEGLRTAEFMRNPVFQPFHKHHASPLGQFVRVWRETGSLPKATLGDVLFAKSNPLSDVTLGLYLEGACRLLAGCVVPLSAAARFPPRAARPQQVAVRKIGADGRRAARVRGTRRQWGGTTMAADEGDALTDAELERLDEFARQDIGGRDSNIGTIARARTIRRLIEELRRERRQRDSSRP